MGWQIISPGHPLLLSAKSISGKAFYAVLAIALPDEGDPTDSDPGQFRYLVIGEQAPSLGSQQPVWIDGDAVDSVSLSSLTVKTDEFPTLEF